MCFPPDHDKSITVSDDVSLLNRCTYKLYCIEDDNGILRLKGKTGTPINTFNGIFEVSLFLQSKVAEHMRADGPPPVDITCPLGIIPELHVQGVKCHYNCPLQIKPPSQSDDSDQFISESAIIVNLGVEVVYALWIFVMFPYLAAILFYKKCSSIVSDLKSLSLSFLCKFEKFVYLVSLFKNEIYVSTLQTIDNFKKAFAYVISIIGALLLARYIYNWTKVDVVEAVSEIMSNPVKLDDAGSQLPINMRYPDFKPLPVEGVPKFPYGTYSTVQLCKGINDFTFDLLRTKVASNCVRMFIPNVANFGRAFYINSNLFVFNYHTYIKMINEYNVTPTTTVTVVAGDSIVDAGIKYSVNLSRVVS